MLRSLERPVQDTSQLASRSTFLGLSCREHTRSGKPGQTHRTTQGTLLLRGAEAWPLVPPPPHVALDVPHGQSQAISGRGSEG